VLDLWREISAEDMAVDSNGQLHPILADRSEAAPDDLNMPVA